jgi:hypothetical protein
VCRLSHGQLACVPLSSGSDAGASDGGTTTACNADSDCSGAGVKCIDGVCTIPADQCFDQTQCSANEQCVNGVCTPSCDAQHPCPTGYACDTQKGVCAVNPAPCGGVSNQACGGGTLCVESHCVPPCANNTCAGTLICVNGGCIPDQKATFVCQTEGVKDACATGSICLHHNCYVACAIDAGVNACQAVDKFNVCKPVTTSTGTYDVCGSATNLGNECDPTQNKSCVQIAAICIDGFCK